MDVGDANDPPPSPPTSLSPQPHPIFQFPLPSPPLPPHLSFSTNCFSTLSTFWGADIPICPFAFLLLPPNCPQPPPSPRSPPHLNPPRTAPPSTSVPPPLSPHRPSPLSSLSPQPLPPPPIRSPTLCGLPRCQSILIRWRQRNIDISLDVLLTVQSVFLEGGSHAYGDRLWMASLRGVVSMDLNVAVERSPALSGLAHCLWRLHRKTASILLNVIPNVHTTIRGQDFFAAPVETPPSWYRSGELRCDIQEGTWSLEFENYPNLFTFH